MRGSSHRRHRNRITIDIAVVGQHVNRDLGILRRGCDIVDGRWSVIDCRDRHRDHGGGRRGAVADGVRKAVAAREVSLRLIRHGAGARTRRRNHSRAVARLTDRQESQRIAVWIGVVETHVDRNRCVFGRGGRVVGGDRRGVRRRRRRRPSRSCMKHLVQIDTARAESEVAADGAGADVFHRSGRRDRRIDLPQQGRAARNEGGAERGSPRGGIAPARICRQQRLTGRRDPYQRISEITELAALVVRRGGADADRRPDGRRERQRLAPVVAHRRDDDNAVTGRVIDGARQLDRAVRHAEAHRDHRRAMLGGVVDGADHVEQLRGPVAVECLQRHDVRRRRDQPNEAGHHRSVAEHVWQL